MILSKETALFQKGAIANLASSSKYITKINDSGIKIHPYDDIMGTADANHFLSLTAEGMQIYNGGASDGNVIAKFNTTNNNPAVTIGFTSTGKYNTHITQDGLYLRNGINSYATLNTNGLTISTGGIKAGTEKQSGFVYLSSEDYQLKDTTHDGLTINGHTPTAAGTDGKTVSDPAWREIIGTKFGVDSEGNLYARDANISGNLTITGHSDNLATEIDDKANASDVATLKSAISIDPINQLSRFGLSDGFHILIDSNENSSNKGISFWYGSETEPSNKTAFIDGKYLTIPYTVVLNAMDVGAITGQRWRWEHNETTHHLTLKWIEGGV